MAKMCGDIQNLDPEVQAQLILKFFVDNEAPDGLDMRPDDYSRPMTEIMRRRHAPHQRHAFYPLFAELWIHAYPVWYVVFVVCKKSLLF